MINTYHLYQYDNFGKIYLDLCWQWISLIYKGLSQNLVNMQIQKSLSKTCHTLIMSDRIFLYINNCITSFTWTFACFMNKWFHETLMLLDESFLRLMVFLAIILLTNLLSNISEHRLYTVYASMIINCRKLWVLKLDFTDCKFVNKN